MNGKIVGLLIVLCAAAAGAALYYFQVYGYYYEVEARPGADVHLTPLDGREPVVIAYSGFRAIDADSSPIRYRACFNTELDPQALRESHVVVDDAEPLSAPGWFDCFDAVDLAAQLADGRAIAFLGQKNVRYGVDRIVAINAAGHGYAWHVLNDCGRKAYDGTQVGEDCPPRPQE